MRFLVVFLIVILTNGKAQGEPDQKVSKKQPSMNWVAHVMRQKGKGMPHLKLDTKRLPVLLVPQEGDLRPLVEVKFLFTDPTWTLLTTNGKKIKRTRRPHEFVVYAFLNSQVSELTIVAKNEEGEQKSETIYLFAPEAQEFEVVSPWNALSVSFGLAGLTYEQTRFGILSWRGAAIGVSYETQEGASPFDFHLHGGMTVLSLKSEPVKANPQYIDLRANLSYRFNWAAQSRWRFYGLLGVNYINLISNGSSFGFSGLFSPDLSMRAKHFLTTQSSFIYEFRVTPFENLEIDNQRGVHLSLTWSKTLQSLRRQDLKLTYTQTRFLALDQQIGIEYFLLSLGYSL